MALWDKLGTRGNISDRRGLGGGLGAGAGLLGVVITLALGYYGINVDPNLVNQVIGSVDTSETRQQPAEFAGEDEYERFASAVLGSTDNFWASKISQYPEPTLVLFRDATRSGCGVATTNVGPHYCPADSTIYLDERFFDVLTSQLGAQGGDTAQAYVIAHEVGHHVQNVTGTMQQVQSNSQYRQTGDNSLSVRLELQADCYAGLWANSLRDEGVFEPGDIEEAIDAAAAVGDDHIQDQSGLDINPETWTHGSSRQRVNAFKAGFETGDISRCRL